MKKVFLLLSIVILFSNSCTSVESRGKSMSEDLGSPAKVALLRERANDFWAAFVLGDYARVYHLYDPFYQKSTSEKQFVGNMGTIQYHEFEIKDIKVEGNVAKVRVGIVYSMAHVKFKQREFSVDKTPAEFTETWLYVYDNWYKEYYSTVLDDSVVQY
jgi:hypothetical protein